MKSIGMRNIKTATAVAISIALSKFFHLDSPFYAAIAAVISMQNSVAGSYKAGKNRMLGTVTGAIVGLIFCSISPNNSLLCGIGIVIVIYICNVLKWNKSVTIACIVFIGIMVNLNYKTPAYYSVHRTLDTFIGLSVSFLINMFLKPPTYEAQIKNSCANIINYLYKIPVENLYYNKNIEVKKLKNQIIDLQNKFNAYCKEITKEKNLDIDYIQVLVRVFNETYNHISFVDLLNSECKLNEINYNDLKVVCTLPALNYKYNDTELNIVYNYHVSKIIYNLKYLKKIYPKALETPFKKI